MTNDTIVALCTGPPPTAVAMLRVSGPEAYRVATMVFAPFPDQPEPRRAIYGRFSFGDDGLALPFPQGASYTGEATVELTFHGGRASVDALLDACLQAGARPARGGEFTLRALANGRIDLTQAEAVIETVEAQTATELRIANRNREGGLRSIVESIRNDVRALLAEVEARIDFSEELGDLDPVEVSQRARYLAVRIRRAVDQGHPVHLARLGRRIALIGRPNAGKSSLLNALVGRERAIVTDIPGTTRDTLEETVVLGAARLVLIDTAGLRETDDPIEGLGVERARKAIEEADEAWFLYDGTEGWSPEARKVEAEARRIRGKGMDVIIATKADLPHFSEGPHKPRAIRLSVVMGQGLDELAARYPEPPEAPAVNDRQAAALIPASRVLDEAAGIPDAPLDLLAVLLREADRHLGTVLGDAAPADLLTDLFSRFCIGK